jgi:tetratricopeptide (TPR) repeat protein
VAQSIEKVFDERLHEFYGMLALHYIKGENFEKAERYLIKAGEEALRSSASSEALNYYQEGLKIYLQANQDAADPEKLAMFEKNIAIALYNKCRWMESVQHIDKVFEYWNIPPSPNRLLTIIKFIKNIIFITTGLGRVSKGAKKIPSQRDNEVFRLLFMRCTAMIYFDNTAMFFTQLSSINKICLIDWSKSPEATRFYIGAAITFSGIGLFFKIARKLLDLCKSTMDLESIYNLMAFTYAYDQLNSSSGEWEKIAPFKETLVNNALKKGDLWSVAVYLVYITYVSTDKGDFNYTQRLIDKLSEIALAYDYNLAAVYADIQSTYLLLKKGLLPEAIEKAEEAISFAGRIGMRIQVQIYFCRRAQAQILLNDMDGAKESLANARKIIDQHKYLMPVLSMQYFISQFMADVILLKDAFISKDRKNLSKLKKKARLSGKKALNTSKKFAVHSVEALRLMGKYYWIIGNQKKALKWWDRAIKTGEELGARPDLSRTYLEIGKSLLEPTSNHKELNGITANAYLEKARIMFEEMDLQWDLNELNKVMSHNTGKEAQDDYNK